MAAKDGKKLKQILLRPDRNSPVQIMTQGDTESLRLPLTTLPSAYTTKKQLPRIPICAEFRIERPFKTGPATERLTRATYTAIYAT